MRCFLHDFPPVPGSQAPGFEYPPESLFAGTQVESIASLKVDRYQIGLVYATLRMIDKALKDPGVKRLVCSCVHAHAVVGQWW